MKKIALALIILILSITGVKAQENELSFDDLEYNSFFENAPNPEDIGVFDTFMLEEDIKFIYLGETNNIDTWMTINSVGVRVLSTTLDGKSIIFGAIYDAQGTNIVLENMKALFPTIGEPLYMFSQKEVGESIALELEAFRIENQKQSEERVVDQDLPKADMNKLMWKSLATSNYIEKGNPNAPMIYVFSDVFCGHCTEFSKSIEKYINTSSLRVRYIPVGVLSEASIVAALSILSAPDPSAAWADYYDNHNAMALKNIPTDEGIDNLETNLKLFEKWNLRGTPSMFYKSKTGEVKFLYGKPHDIEEFVKDVSK